MLSQNMTVSLRPYLPPKGVRKSSVPFAPPVLISKADESTAKPGQKTLAELDHYRYVEAPTLFAATNSVRLMQLGDVQTLVEWKLCVLPA